MEEKKSGLCTAALVLGILSIVGSPFLNLGFIPGLIGLIFSIVCLAGRKQPRGKAVGGLVTSIIGLILGCVLGGLGVVLIIAFGASMGGIFAFIAALFVGLAGELNNPEIQDAINNIQVTDNTGYVSDYDGYSLDGDDYDLSFDYDDNEEDYYIVLSNTGFEDLTKHGFKLEQSESDYVVYSKDGAEFEFPAYVLDYNNWGYDHESAYEKFMKSNGFEEDNTNGFGYDDLTDYNNDWEYGCGHKISHYDNENGVYDEYESFMVVFPKNSESNDMIILILRWNKYDDSNDQANVKDFFSLLNYMHSLK
ncbi:MAG: DUF4190 domain-containing protein [Lachnospiraceae bacterium]|nr:DUF4190 domain-containing protein [Lachnospiraceae bacterium]